MSYRSRLKFVEAVAVVTGTIVGAGVMGLPYAFLQVGLFWGTVLVLLVGVAMTVLLLMLGYVSLQSDQPQQLTGYADRYLGKKGKHLLALAMMLNIFGALLAYTIGQGAILSNLFGGDSDVWSYAFFLILGTFVVLGINIIKHLETVLTVSILILFVGLVFLAAPHFSWQSVPAGTVTAANLLTVYGVALAACFGLTSVPQVRHILDTEPPSLTYKAILWGGLIPVCLYILFATLTLGITGLNTSPVAMVGLISELGVVGLMVGSAFSVLAMSSSFLALGLALRNVLYKDYGLPLLVSLVATLGVPFSLFALGIRDFVAVLTVVGGIALNMVGVLSVLIFWQARKKNFASKRKRSAVQLLSILLFSMFLTSMFLVLEENLIL